LILVFQLRRYFDAGGRAQPQFQDENRRYQKVRLMQRRNDSADATTAMVAIEMANGGALRSSSMNETCRALSGGHNESLEWRGAVPDPFVPDHHGRSWPSCSHPRRYFLSILILNWGCARPPRIEVPAPAGKTRINIEESVRLPLIGASAEVESFDRATKIVRVADERYALDTP